MHQAPNSAAALGIACLSGMLWLPLVAPLLPAVPPLLMPRPLSIKHITLIDLSPGDADAEGHDNIYTAVILSNI